MRSIMEIEEAIGQLPNEEMFQLIERLENKASDMWDRQIEQDVRAGRLDAMAQKAISEHREGDSTPFPRDAE